MDLPDQLLTAIDQRDQILEIVAPEQVPFASGPERFELRGQQIARRSGADGSAGGEFDRNRVRERLLLPVILEAEDRRLRGHYVEDQILGRTAEAA